MSKGSWLQTIYVRIIAGALKVYFKLYHRVRIEGLEHIPAQGPLFVILNHVSNLEAFIIGISLVDKGLIPGIDVLTVAKKELFEHRLPARFFRSIGFFPIDRERTDMAAMRTMMTLLKEGKIICIAPEGTRSTTGQLQLFQPVVAKIAVSRRVPLLPAGAIGSAEALPRGTKFPRPVPITLRWGPVFELSEFYNKPMTEEESARAAWVMREHIAELLPEWMRELPPSSSTESTPIHV